MLFKEWKNPQVVMAAIICWPQQYYKLRCQKVEVRELRNNAALVLEDGTTFVGQGFGSPRKAGGEVVFNTGIVGYPESLTDPSYYGQILTFAYPIIGNYGVPPYEERKWGIPRFFESDSIKISGLVVHEYNEVPSHWSSVRNLDSWLKEEGVPAITNIDTRRLTKKLREHGVMLGVIHVCEDGEELNIGELRDLVEAAQDPNERNLVAEVTTTETTVYNCGGNKTVVLLDCGVKYNIIRSFLKRSINVVRVPYDTSTSKILEYEPDGVVVSNGPGDPKRTPKLAQTVYEIANEGLALLGICLGTQMLALAFGGDTYKLKYGHRSQNQPVMDTVTERCYITSQNHGYAVNKDSLEKIGLEIWFMNVNDKTVEGIKHRSLNAFAVQFHPEHTPGPVDTEYVFGQFIKVMESKKSA